MICNHKQGLKLNYTSLNSNNYEGYEILSCEKGCKVVNILPLEVVKQKLKNLIIQNGDNNE